VRRESAGLLLYRRIAGGPEVLLIHPGGPFWAKKDDGAWSIPKGEFGGDEEPLSAALREFEEEVGLRVSGPMIPLTPRKQPSGKIVHAWAMEKDVDLSAFKSNSFALEWPPRSGKFRNFPEADRAAWFDLATARRKILKGQAGFLDELERMIAGDQQ